MGAPWQRLVRQLLTDTALFGLLGGAADLLVALAAIRAARAINLGNSPLIDRIGIDGRVLAFTITVSLAAGILFGLAPALRCCSASLASTASSRISSPRARMTSACVWRSAANGAAFC